MLKCIAIGGASSLLILAGCASAPMQTRPLSHRETAAPVISEPAPVPLADSQHSVVWWFAFKFNARSFPQCPASAATDSCSFGGESKPYPKGLQYVVASSQDARLRKGNSCLGSGDDDPVGATFGQIYNGDYYFVLWNDQFYAAPSLPSCAQNCSSPWGHSKGMVAWNDEGEGVVMQVTTPSWPGAGSAAHPRLNDGNTLGCVKDDNVAASQHFFALRLNREDLLMVLAALVNASVATDPTNPQIVRNGGPAEVQARVEALGRRPTESSVTFDTLSTGVGLISKPSAVHIPPWQLVSSVLGGVPLMTATWWLSPQIADTTASSTITCWDAALAPPSAVRNATEGQWEGVDFNLKGGAGNNHAKIGISTASGSDYVIFGDLNQQGALDAPDCAKSQNGRGGLFFVVHDPVLRRDVATLLSPRP